MKWNLGSGGILGNIPPLPKYIIEEMIMPLVDEGNITYLLSYVQNTGRMVMNYFQAAIINT